MERLLQSPCLSVHVGLDNNGKVIHEIWHLKVCITLEFIRCVESVRRPLFEIKMKKKQCFKDRIAVRAQENCKLGCSTTFRYSFACGRQLLLSTKCSVKFHLKHAVLDKVYILDN
jgi:hypothetical protein